MAGHSPWPWRWDTCNNSGRLRDADGADVIPAVDDDPEYLIPEHADGRLIAAAPELLDLLQRNWHSDSCRCTDCHDRRRLLARLTES
jgi:hypothetical protein